VDIFWSGTRDYIVLTENEVDDIISQRKALFKTGEII